MHILQSIQKLFAILLLVTVVSTTVFKPTPVFAQDTATTSQKDAATFLAECAGGVVKSAIFAILSSAGFVNFVQAICFAIISFSQAMGVIACFLIDNVITIMFPDEQAQCKAASSTVAEPTNEETRVPTVKEGI